MIPEFCMGDRRFFAALCALLFFVCLPLVQAQVPAGTSDPVQEQTEEPTHYFIEESEHGSVLYQRLSWQKVDDILGYEFELEKEDDNGKWRRIDKKLVKDNFTDVSLPPGSYRYKITVINLLEQAEASSAYRNFEILIAHQPEVESVSPQLIYLDEFFDGIFAASGAYFLRHTVFFLSKQGSAPIALVPTDLSKDGKKVRFELNLNKFNPGVYTFTVRDISGLTDKSKTVTFKFQKPVDAYVSVGYAFTGFAGQSAFQTFYNRNVAPLGGMFRFSLLPIKRTYGNFGFNLTYSAALMNSKHEYYRLNGTLMTAQLNGVYIYPLIKHRLNLDVHAGFGAVFLVNSRFVFDDGSIKSPAYWYWGPGIGAGTSVQILNLFKKMYVEAGVEHFIVFRKGMPKYIVQPEVSVGWLF